MGFNLVLKIFSFRCASGLKMAFNRIKTRAPDGANMYKHEKWTKKINRDFIKGDGGEGLHFMK